MSRPSSRFLSQLAHDLRSPLNVIGSTLTELSSDTGVLTAADRQQVLTLSGRAVSRMIALCDRLSLASRLEQSFELVVVPVDLVQLTRSTLEHFIPGQLRKRIEVITAFPEAPVPVLADVTLLTTLLLELLANANRFARRILRVEVSVAETAVVSIEDDGEGVKEDERTLLFEPFAERRSRTGLGMGLWLAKRLAQLHHGDLTLAHLVVGTGQELTLPVAK